MVMGSSGCLTFNIGRGSANLLSACFHVAHRMHAIIAEFPNKIMYSGRLKSHESVSSRLLRDLPNVVSAAEEDRGSVDKEALETPVVFFDTASCEFFERVDSGSDEGSKCNENEAEIVKRWVDDLVGWFLDLMNTC
jgi:DNA polymerase alpha-associated DNA helicase A